MSGGTTTDAATQFKPGDRLRVSFEGVVDRDGDFKATGGTHSYVGTPTREPATPADLVELYGALLDVVGGTPPAPAPYTEPRDGDEVEVTVFGVVNRGGFIESDSCVDINSRVYVGADVLRSLAAEGRVRLVKAAAPQFEAGRIYRSETDGATYLFSPDGELALSTSQWFRLSTGDWVQDTSVPSDLVPCDVVPREAT